MKNKTITLKLAAIVSVLALSLAGCGEAASTSKPEEESTETVSAEEYAKAEALAEELLTRTVTPDDHVTKAVIEAAITKLKGTYSFETLDELKLASGDWIYYSQNQGWFEDLFGDNGTEVIAVEGTVGNEVQLMERDELHLTNRMLYPYLLFKSQGADLTAVALSEDPNPDIVSILVDADSDIYSFEDLKGKTVGSWNAGCQYVALIEQINELGWVEGQDWTYKNISNNDLKTALQAGEIDAISTHPFANVNSEIINGNFREIATAKENGVYVNTGGASVTFTYNDFADSYPNILKATLKLRELVNAYIIENLEEVCVVLEEITRTPVENNVFYTERRDETYYSALGSLSELIEETEVYQNWLIENTEEFTEEARVPKEEFFNTEFFE